MDGQRSRAECSGRYIYHAISALPTLPTLQLLTNKPSDQEVTLTSVWVSDSRSVKEGKGLSHLI